MRSASLPATSGAARATGARTWSVACCRDWGGRFDAVALRTSFEDKGVSAMLRGSLFLVQADDLAARGLARLLAGEVRAPIFETRGDETTPIRS
jgi:hypothetical protein